MTPRATGDQLWATVGRVWVSTMDIHRLAPPDRRCARSRWLRSRSRDHRRRRPDSRRRDGSADAYDARARPRGEPRLIVRSEYVPEMLVYAGFGHHSTFNHRLIAANMSTTPGLTGPRRLDRKNPQYRSHAGTHQDLMGETVLGIEVVPHAEYRPVSGSFSVRLRHRPPEALDCRKIDLRMALLRPYTAKCMEA